MVEQVLGPLSPALLSAAAAAGFDPVQLTRVPEDPAVAPAAAGGSGERLALNWPARASGTAAVEAVRRAAGLGRRVLCRCSHHPRSLLVLLLPILRAPRPLCVSSSDRGLGGMGTPAPPSPPSSAASLLLLQGFAFPPHSTDPGPCLPETCGRARKYTYARHGVIDTHARTHTHAHTHTHNDTVVKHARAPYLTRTWM
jgi:hypothetical protein